MEKPEQMKVGQRFSRLVVLGLDEVQTLHTKKTYYRVKCDCGMVFSTLRESLLRGTTRSCGCLRTDLLRDKNRPMQKVEWNGEEHTFREWSKITGITEMTLRARHKAGFVGDKLFSKTNMKLKTKLKEVS